LVYYFSRAQPELIEYFPYFQFIKKSFVASKHTVEDIKQFFLTTEANLSGTVLILLLNKLIE
jgi:hypothetical protein